MSTAQKTERMFMRIEPELLARVDEWRARQRPIPSRSEAVRRLVYDAICLHEGHRIQAEQYMQPEAV